MFSGSGNIILRVEVQSRLWWGGRGTFVTDINAGFTYKLQSKSRPGDFTAFLLLKKIIN